MVGIILVASWWLWPRIDPRFIGEWAILDIHGIPLGTILTLQGDGSASGTDEQHYRWSVANDFLTLRRVTGDVVDDLALLGRYHWNGYTAGVLHLRIQVVGDEPSGPRLLELYNPSGRLAMMFSLVGNPENDADGAQEPALLTK